MSTVHVVVPAGLDDPTRPSGGNGYDRRICRGLAAAGWRVVEHAAAGTWPCPDPADERALARLIAGLADGAVVLIDGLIASAVPAVLVPEADRLRLVVLVHLSLAEASGADQLPRAEAGEGAVLGAAEAVVTTSRWTRDRLLVRYGLPPTKVRVARPGVDLAPLAPGTGTGTALLCVAAVARHKGHDVLLGALTRAAALPWRCACVGALDREPAFVDGLRSDADAAGIGDRVSFDGPRVGADLDRAYADADLLVLASRGETYGMVVTEALARGLPVVVSDVGGLPEALGRTSDGRPGLLVPPGDSAALAAALHRWLVDPDLRSRLRQAARQRRSTLAGWEEPVARIGRVLTEAAAA